MSKPIDLMLDAVDWRCSSCGQTGCGCDIRPDDDGVPISIKRGTLRIGDLELGCHVLSDGMRIFTAESIGRFFTALGGVEAP